MTHASSHAGQGEQQRGHAALEFTIVAMIFFLLFFGLVEIARAMYICNTLQEVTRRAAALAAHADFTSDAGLDQVRVQAVFRADAGLLLFGDPITDRYVKIDYLSIPAGASVPAPVSGTRPVSPLQNRTICLNNPNAANCIALVRARICRPGTDCVPAPYVPLVSLVPFSFSLPRATTIVRAESLGMPPGVPSEGSGPSPDLH